MASLRRRGWLEVDNGDLWELLDGILLSRDPSSVLLVKVKGHATWSDVRSGVVAWADKRANDAADGLARRGAKAHALDEAFASRVRGERRLTRVVQAICLILLSRGMNIAYRHCFCLPAWLSAKAALQRMIA